MKGKIIKLALICLFFFPASSLAVNVDAYHSISALSTQSCAPVSFNLSGKGFYSENGFTLGQSYISSCNVIPGSTDVSLKHTSVGISEGASILSDQLYGLGVFSAKVYIPDEPGIIVSFFLYKEIDGKIYETDFEFVPNDRALYVGTYNAWTWTEEYEYERHPPFRDKPVENYGKIEMPEKFWGAWHTLKIEKTSSVIKFYIDNEFIWETDKAVPTVEQHVMFNIWSPTTPGANEFPNPGVVSNSNIEYQVSEFSSTPLPPVLALSTSGTNLTLSWTSVSDATGYTLFHAPYPGVESIGTIDMGAETGGSFSLWEGAAFYLAVEAYNSFGNSGLSNIEYFIMGYSLSVSPASLSISQGQTGSCTISGGTGPYSAASSKTAVATVSVSSSTVTVTGVSAGSATVTVSDSGGDSVTVSVTVSGGSPATYTNSLGMTFILLPAGTFTMGSPSSEPGRYSVEGPQHQVTLTQSFYMQQTEVTEAQWEAVMGSKPFYFSCPTCPVGRVSWDDVQTFIGHMNARGEGTYNLPTEAQWEYAARAGSTTAFYNGGITSYPDMDDCNYDGNLNAIGWYCYNDYQDYPVAGKSPNAWGLYDMSGNMYEWCQDWYGYYPTGAVTDPTGPSSGSHRVFRGGSKGNHARRCRSAFRSGFEPDHWSFSVGFRLTRQP